MKEITDYDKVFETLVQKTQDYVVRNNLSAENGVKLLYYSDLDIRYPYEVFTNKQLLLNEIKKQL